ncbi:hypothetical protein [Dyadobacter sp. Leaf189]|uniref:hypothetical protein n=1 Tax=Dyadobacter sp. Leaf189 TaxID=1736295 RepID=UPI0006FD20B7|nr:hypothetical protein [Dyadobacter sp. Leaf189]KQS31426.1 hypothetical protein ASG33_14035 [Dyadobacter sp. Leaf189]
MLKKLLLFAWIGVMVLAVSSCEGPEGPAGPKGDTGAAGPAGPAGPAGEDGEDGTGSGMSGSVIAFMGEIETDTSGNMIVGDTAFFADATDEEILSFEKGMFQVFLKDNGAYFPVPGYVLFEDEAISYGYYYQIDGNGLYFPIFRTSAADNPQRSFEEVRVVFIPALNAGKQNANVNWKNYDEAVKALGLTEADVKVIRKK